MTIIPLLAGAGVALFGLAMLVMPGIGRNWRHPDGQPLPSIVLRLFGLLLVVAGLWLAMIFIRH